VTPGEPGDDACRKSTSVRVFEVRIATAPSSAVGYLSSKADSMAEPQPIATTMGWGTFAFGPPCVCSGSWIVC
jgi:hypothetical protein